VTNPVARSTSGYLPLSTTYRTKTRPLCPVDAERWAPGVGLCDFRGEGIVDVQAVIMIETCA